MIGDFGSKAFDSNIQMVDEIYKQGALVKVQCYPAFFEKCQDYLCGDYNSFGVFE